MALRATRDHRVLATGPTRARSARLARAARGPPVLDGGVVAISVVASSHQERARGQTNPPGALSHGGPRTGHGVLRLCTRRGLPNTARHAAETLDFRAFANDPTRYPE